VVFNYIELLREQEHNFRGILCKLMKINAPVEVIVAVYTTGYEFFTQVEKGIINRALRYEKLNEKT